MAGLEQGPSRDGRGRGGRKRGGGRPPQGGEGGSKRGREDEDEEVEMPPSTGEEEKEGQPQPKKRTRATASTAARPSGSEQALLTCGRCGAQNDGSEAVEWVQAPNDDGDLFDTGSACRRCWNAYCSGWKTIGWEWKELCGKCSEDSGINKKFELTCVYDEQTLD